MVVESMGGGNAGADQMMPYGDDALYGKELRDALGSFPGAFPAAQPAEGAAADPKSTLANYEIRGVAQVFDGAPTDVYVDGNATDDAADSALVQEDDPKGKFCIQSVVGGIVHRLHDTEGLIGMTMKFEAGALALVQKEKASEHKK